MGIKRLLIFLSENAGKSFSNATLDQYAGKIIVCNATSSMAHFLLSTQFLASVGTGMLVDDLGDPTAHLVGLFSRTIQLIEVGIKPVWVFSKQVSDLAPNSRYIKNRQNEIRGYPKRSTKITEDMTADAIKMLRFLGVPIVQAPESAEAQCAELVNCGKCHAAISEDTEALAYGCKTIIKGVKNKNDPVVEIRYDNVLRQLDLTRAEFIDLCILLGTKRCKNINGMGPKNIYKYIQQCSTIENIIEKIINGHKRYQLPKEFDYQSERNYFLDPVVNDHRTVDLEWRLPDEKELKQFLIVEKGFSSARVENGLKAIYAKYGKPTQLKIESFFTNPVKRPPAAVKKTLKKKKKFK